MKWILNLIGALAVLLAIAGIFLPLVPTTPFLLLASACFARGSTRMHRWLTTNRFFGRYLLDFENRRGLPLRGKLFIWLTLWISLGFGISRLNSLALQVLLGAIGLAVSVYVYRFPTLARENGA